MTDNGKVIHVNPQSRDREEVLKSIEEQVQFTDKRRRTEAAELASKEAKPALELLEHPVWDEYCKRVQVEIDKANKNLEAFRENLEAGQFQGTDQLINMKMAAVYNRGVKDMLTWALTHPKELIEQAEHLETQLKDVPNS